MALVLPKPQLHSFVFWPRERTASQQRTKDLDSDNMSGEVLKTLTTRVVLKMHGTGLQGVEDAAVCVNFGSLCSREWGGTMVGTGNSGAIKMQTQSQVVHGGMHLYFQRAKMNLLSR